MTKLNFFIIFLLIVLIPHSKITASESIYPVNELPIRIIVQNFPAHEFSRYLEKIWKITESDDQEEKNDAWICLHYLDRYSDGLKAALFSRFCWFKCKSAPLAFYQRYLGGDSWAIDYYEAASLYDVWAFEEDGISSKEFIRVLDSVLEGIKSYNQKKSIDSGYPATTIEKYFNEAKKIEKDSLSDTSP